MNIKPQSLGKLYILVLVLELLELCHGSTSNGEVSSLRGVQPHLKAKYLSSDGQFTCLRTGEVIPAAHVNDDYCDCKDGSDEPGTSACSNGHFYCKNRGHTPQVLNSSFVDDGYCDCCDGTDEAVTKCKNTCEEAGAENRAALRKKSSTFGTGLKLRRQYISQAVTDRQKWEQDLKVRRKEEQALQREVNKLRGKKERIEKIEAKERAAEELKRKLKEEEESAEKTTQPEVADPDQSEVTDTATGSQTSIADIQAKRQTDNPVEKSAEQINEEYAKEYLAKSRAESNPGLEDPAFLEKAKAELNSGSEELSEEAKAKLKQEQLEEEGRRIASQWTSDPDAASVGDAEAATSEAVSAESSEVPDASDASLTPEEEEEDLAEEEEESGFVAWVKRLFQSQPWDGPDPLSEKAKNKIKDAYHASNNKLSETSRQRADLEKKLNQDFGPDNVFLTLADRCISADVDKYVYEVCFFGAAAQKDGGMSTSLGSFARFENNFSTMVYEGGQGCWSGPSRSIRVELGCGKKEELSGVNEPNRCEYQATLTTPAACREAEYQAVLSELKSIEESADKSEL